MVERRLEIIGDIESIGMAEITVDEISLAIDTQGLNVLQIVTLQSTERYCAFLDPRRLAAIIVHTTAPTTRKTDMPERIYKLIAETFADTNYATMKMECLDDGRFHVRIEKSQPRSSKPITYN